MFRVLLAMAFAITITNTLIAQVPDDPFKKYPEYASVIKGAKEFDGLFKLFLKDDHLLAEIQPYQFDRPFLATASIAKGAGMGGTTLGGTNTPVLVFKKAGDKVFLVRRNVRFTARAGTPAGKTVETTYTDSVLMNLPVKTVNPLRLSTVVDFNAIYFSDFAGLGNIDPNRSTWHKVKAYKKNIELQVAATFFGRVSDAAPNGGGSVIDNRGTTLIVHYGLTELPESGYTPRQADDRVGHFLTAFKDFSKETNDTPFVRFINRWRLERADGSPWKEGAKLVPPKKKIVFWIENSVPDEYRAAVREGILEWNKAFEKIGFRDAIEVRQQEGEDFDPEDVSYATFRWIASEASYAIGPSRVNPFTGEIFDADILFDASMLRAYKQEQRLFRNDKGELYEPASAVQASRRGWGLLANPLAGNNNDLGWDDRKFNPKDPNSILRARLHAVESGACQCAAHKTSELGFAMMHMMAQAGLKDGDKLPDELVLQAVKETTMHEVGHTLGLRHNFKSSTVLTPEQLHDTAFTRKNGLTGSVMDYTPANIAPKGTKQGDYFSTTLGAYDYWAIEYAYKPLSGGTEGEVSELQKIASRCAEPGLTYGTDEDLLASSDPLVNQWDIGADPLRYAQDRVKIAEEMLGTLADRAVEKGEGYQRLRGAFNMTLRQYGDAAALATKFVGGEALYRDHKGDPNARDPFVPVTAAKQRDAMKFLKEKVLTDKPFTSFNPELLRKLAANRWMHWGSESAMRPVDYPLHEKILEIHNVALNELFDSATLARIQNAGAKANKTEEPFTLAELFKNVTESAFPDVGAKTTTVARNLQRAYVTKLSELTLAHRGNTDWTAVLMGFNSVTTPADARSLARFHLKELNTKIATTLKDARGLDDVSKAHLSELNDQITKVLAANISVME